VFVLGFSGCDSSKDPIGEGDPGTKEPGGADTTVSLNLDTLYLGLDQDNNSATLEAAVSPANAANKAVTWTSSDEAVATVDANGKVTGHKEGTATVTVTTAAGKNTAVCNVTVQAGMVKAEVGLAPPSLVLEEGETETLDLTVNPDTAKVQWKSSNTGVATVDAKTGKVKGVKAGTATVTVTAVNGGNTATCALTVKPNTAPPADVDGLDGTPGDKQVVLSWTDPADADLDHIEITWTPNGTTPQPVAVNKGIQTYTATGLANSTPYTFTVKAVDTAKNKNTGATVTETPAATGELAGSASSQPNIKLKFEGSKDETGKDGVNAAFQELSAFIKKGGLADYSDTIQLGDYIELEAGLTVAAYPGTDGNGGGGFSYASNDPDWNADITIATQYSMGKMNRLIVVGINSFNEKNGNGTTPHVVFQFQNIPVSRRMNAPIDVSDGYFGDGTNTGGYPASEMRKYLTPVGNDKESGKFLAGLVKAGLPEAVLWEPSRIVSTNGGTMTINDLLWLPTEWEMYGGKMYGPDGSAEPMATDEDGSNQVKLEYYKTDNDSDPTFVLHLKAATGKALAWTDPASYWLASATNVSGTGQFCLAATSSISSSRSQANTWQGVAPAFCVQGWQ
jgi:hypothetical protein